MRGKVAVWFVMANERGKIACLVAILTALRADAEAQTKVEQSEWPYNWYTNPYFVKESGRRTITGAGDK
jgi:hypothetical protein